MANISYTIDYNARTGHDFTSGSGSERWVNIRRFNAEGEFEKLFVGRFKYFKAGSKATRYCRKVAKRFNLDTVTQEELDAFRVAQVSF